MVMKNNFPLILAIAIFFISCTKKNLEPISEKQNQERRKTEMVITSSAFKEGEMIPSKFTCDGDDISPQLSWSGVPENTKSFALINDDPDAPAGDWVHWVIFNIPGSVTELLEKIPADKILDNGTKQGKNDFGKIGYGGPCPPGGTHRYYFKLYALDVYLDKDAGISKNELLNAMEGHILAEAQLMGRYKRN
jgi:Raf kinase inhibitor-like YbhB/YbcL family protein